jgi:hypothetical protein
LGDDTRTMTTRNELKSLIDQRPEHSIKTVHQVLTFHLNRPPLSEKNWERARRANPLASSLPSRATDGMVHLKETRPSRGVQKMQA